MDIDFLGATGCGQFRCCQHMVFVAVNAARRQQAHDVNGLAIGYGFIDGVAQGFVALELAVFEVFVDTGQALVHHPAGAEVHVAYFRVTHLALRQAYKHA